MSKSRVSSALSGPGFGSSPGRTFAEVCQQADKTFRHARLSPFLPELVLRHVIHATPLLASFADDDAALYSVTDAELLSVALILQKACQG